MGEHYRQLSYEERCTIARLREAGQSIQKIAAALDRPASTISRELKRNAGTATGYDPGRAGDQAWARRWRGMRLDRDDALREAVLGGLSAGWSPEQVAGRLALEAGRRRISHESIYRFLYAQIRRTNDGTWRHYLPRAKSKRGWRARPGGSSTSFIKERVPIGQRPPAAADRSTPGHWEADYMLFKRYGDNILVVHERTTRITLFTRLPNRKAPLTVRSIAKLVGPWPKRMRSTLTFDNGTEFAHHYKLKRKVGMQTYFCDPHSPWQKGGIENAIGRIRRYLPRNTSLDTLSPARLAAIAQRINNTPRKCLDFKTPAEACSDLLLHFECESTPPLSRG
jgi:IS30 family transposase